MRAPSDALDLLLFTTNTALAAEAMTAGIDQFVVDWEWEGKDARQEDYDTEINRDSPDDLRRLAQLPARARFCRINAFSERTAEEVALAVGAGATHVFLPMVQRPDEVEAFVRLLDDRAGACILVETQAAVRCARALADLPLDRVYVGLNDLRISRGSASIFDAVADGTVEHLRAVFSDVAFGFGGLTVVDGGPPLPCMRLLEEMVRLHCCFSFLRRSFKRDIRGRDLAMEVHRLRAAETALRQRSAAQTEADHARLCRAVQGIGATGGGRS